MSRRTRNELNNELDELLDYMIPAYNATHPDNRLSAGRVDANGNLVYGKDRGKIWGAFLFARTEYLFKSLRAAAQGYTMGNAEHPARWFTHRLWLPPDRRPKVVAMPREPRKKGSE